MKKTLTALSLIAAGLCAAPAPAFAQSQGAWAVGVGAHQVDPKSGNGSLAGGTLPVDVGSDAEPTLTAEYFVLDDLGIEVVAALPFKHDIAIEGLGKVGSTKELPPTFSLQYHFNSAGKVAPFVGAGLNYTAFFGEDTRGALAGSRLKLDDSWGLAAHAGIDFAVGKRGAIRIDARWIDIDTEVKLDGAKLGTVEVDPLAYGAAYVFRF
jgi:outer membrane protein